MPIFEYLCDDCGSKFEKLVRNGEAVACPSCGDRHLTPQLSTFAAQTGGKKYNDVVAKCPSGACPTPDMCGLN